MKPVHFPQVVRWEQEKGDGWIIPETLNIMPLIYSWLFRILPREYGNCNRGDKQKYTYIAHYYAMVMKNAAWNIQRKSNNNKHEQYKKQSKSDAMQR